MPSFLYYPIGYTRQLYSAWEGTTQEFNAERQGSLGTALVAGDPGSCYHMTLHDLIPTWVSNLFPHPCTPCCSPCSSHTGLSSSPTHLVCSCPRTFALTIPTARLPLPKRFSSPEVSLSRTSPLGPSLARPQSPSCQLSPLSQY